MGDPYRSKCSECDALRQTVLAQKQEHEETTKKLNDQVDDLRSRWKAAKSDAWRGRLPYVAVAMVLAFIVWHIHRALVAPEGPCRATAEVIDHSNFVRHCAAGGVLEAHPFGDGDRVLVICTCPHEPIPLIERRRGAPRQARRPAP